MAQKPKPGGGVADFTCCAPYSASLTRDSREIGERKHGNWWAAGEPVRFRFINPKPTSAGELEIVRSAFAAWRAHAPGLDIGEAASNTERAQIRIAFNANDPRFSWSKVGVDAANVRAGPTMNFAESLSTPAGKLLALHEAGHALGFRHEHQNPIVGIEWNEIAVVRHYDKKGWSEDYTREQIIRKLAADEFDAAWDPASIMNYAFTSGLIRTPAAYKSGLALSPVLSAGDKARAARAYALNPAPPLLLTPVKPQPVAASLGAQSEFVILPQESRNYDIETMGEFDSVFAIFEQDGQTEHFLGAARDAGVEVNASLRIRLIAGRRYVVRLRPTHIAGEAPIALVLL